MQGGSADEREKNLMLIRQFTACIFHTDKELVAEDVIAGLDQITMIIEEELEKSA